MKLLPYALELLGLTHHFEADMHVIIISYAHTFILHF